MVTVISFKPVASGFPVKVHTTNPEPSQTSSCAVADQVPSGNIPVLVVIVPPKLCQDLEKEYTISAVDE